MRKKLKPKPLWGIFVTVCFTGNSWACTICNSETGNALREGLFHGELATRVLATVSPFLVFMTLAILLTKGKNL